jgi:hypothetical protein
MEWFSACAKANHAILGVNASPDMIRSAVQRIGPLAEKYMAKAMRKATPRQQREHLIEKTTMFEKFTSDAGPYAEAVLSNLLKSIVVQSWTAIEVLTEELYAETENQFPKNFAHLSKKPRFRSRDAFRETYRRAFGNNAPDIFAALNDTSIDALALLRNVIVHKSGLADEDFRKGVALTPLLSRFSRLRPDGLIVLDGELVRSILDPAFQSGYKLIVALNRWLNLHKRR